MKLHTDRPVTSLWMTVPQVAAYLGLSPATIYDYVSDRRIPFVKIPKSNQVRFNRVEIDAWMTTGGVPTLEEALYHAGGDNHGNTQKKN